MKIKAEVHNITKDLHAKYIVCSVVDGELWYYTQSDDLEKVKRACRDELVNKCYFEVDYESED